MIAGLLAVHHRAGNDLDTLQAGLDAGADLVEADLHSYRGRLEVRHTKSLGPWWLWDRGEFGRRTAWTRLELAELLGAGGSSLLLDLKGVHPRLAGRVAGRLATLPPDATVTVCTQHWWMLRAFAGNPRVRLMLSAGSRRGLRRLRRRLSGGPVYGVCVHRALLTPRIVAELRDRTDLVLTWPVDSEHALADARRLGVGGVISKDLEVIRRVRAGRSAAQPAPQQ